MDIVTVYLGVEREVCAVARSGKEEPLYEEELYPDLSAEYINKLETHIEHLGDVSLPIQNFSAIKKLRHEPNLWELIAKPVRLFFFFVGHKQVVITNGFIKKRNDTPRKHIDKARKLMEDYRREI